MCHHGVIIRHRENSTLFYSYFPDLEFTILWAKILFLVNLNNIDITIQRTSFFVMISVVEIPD
jgi:hypothetical protein